MEVEAPTLNAENIVLMNGGTEVALRSTAFGAGAILTYDGISFELAVGVTVAASPDVAITVLGADGAVLFSDHSRIALAPSAGGVAPSSIGRPQRVFLAPPDSIPLHTSFSRCSP